MHPRNVRAVEAALAQPRQDVARVVAGRHHVFAAQSLRHRAGKVARHRQRAFAPFHDGRQHHARLRIAGRDAAQYLQRVAEALRQAAALLISLLQPAFADILLEHPGVPIDVGQRAHLAGRQALQAQPVLDHPLHEERIVAHGVDIGFLDIAHAARVQAAQMLDAAFEVLMHADIDADLRRRHFSVHAQRLFDGVAQIGLDLPELALLFAGQRAEAVVDHVVAASIAQRGAAGHQAHRDFVLQRLLGGALEVVEKFLRSLSGAILAEHIHQHVRGVLERVLLEGLGPFNGLAQYLHGLRAAQHAGMRTAAGYAQGPVGQRGQAAVKQLAVLGLDVGAHPVGLRQHLLDAVAGQRPPLGHLGLQVARHDVGDLVAVFFAQGTDEAVGGRLVGRDLRIAACHAIPGTREEIADVALAGRLQAAVVVERETRVGGTLRVVGEAVQLNAGHDALLRPSWPACRRAARFRAPSPERERNPIRHRPGGRPSVRRS
ncbi:hypothetical protein FQZ97_692630 [compost metagenome]